MPQITKLWFFASASLYSANPLKSSILPFNPSFSSSSTFKSKTHQIFFAIPPRFTLFSASARSKIHHRRNSNSTLRNTKTGEKGAEMEANESQEFNKRRAEGRDKGERKALQLKTRKLNPVSTICYAQILGTGMDTQDTSPSVFLFFDKQRFIFNAGEGFQRFCTEHKVKLSKIDHVFLTRVCSETAGGLPGLLLTLAGIGDDGMSVNLWGPSDLKYLIDAMRSFIPNAAMVHTHSFGPEPLSNSSPGILADPIVLIDDEVVKISAILLRPSCSTSSPNLEDIGSSANCSSDLEGKMDEFSGHLTLNSQSSPKNVEGVLKPGDIAVIYVCELPEIMGKFDPEKAKALGLKPGPKYRELQLGNSVMSDRQNVMVHPSDVLGPSSPGPIVVLVDCSTLSHLQELLSVQSLHRYYVDSTDCNGDDFKTVNCIIHLGPSSVTTTTVYQKWMKRFGGAQHIMAGHEMKNIEVPILKASARIASRLNYLCPQFFPAPGFWSLKDPNNFPMNSLSSSKDASSMLCQSIPAENLLKFVLRPYANLGLNRTDIPSTLTASEVISELHSEIPEIVDASKNVRQLWHDPGEAKTLPPMLDSQIIIEEPWMDGNACIPCTNLWEQNGDALQEEIPHLSGCETGAVEHDSDIPSCLENVTREDMEIVLLGTGSSQPSKYRNVSSIYVNLFSKGSVLLDCGEGTLAQLKRRFGVKGADDAVKGLKFIWISHIHADHHTGLARILSLRTQLLRGVPHEPLLVIGPKQLKRFLDAYSRLEDLDMHFLDCRHTTKALIDAYEDSLESSIEHSSMHNSDDFAELGPADSVNLNKRDERFGGALGMALSRKLETTLFAGGRMQSYWNRPGSQGETAIDIPGIKKLKEVLCNAGLEALISVPVVHCPQAFGVVLKAVERNNLLEKIIPGWSLVYSGDTRPCQSLIDASHGATVLIHEATFEDSMVEEAVARNHSTTKEAIEVGTSAGAYRVILTHFSQRYPKIPVFDETHMQKTCIAFDMMSVNLADLPVLPKVLPSLKLLFRNEMVGDEERDISVAP